MELHTGHHAVVQWLGMTFHMDTLINTWVAMAIVIVIAFAATRKRALIPSGIQNVVEFMLESLENELKPTLGQYWSMVNSLLFTMFLFIFVSNELGLFPTNHLLASPTADLNTTIALALATSVTVWVIGMRVKGLHYFHHFVEPTPGLLPINLFEEVAKPITLAFRLFGNIVAGEILLEVLHFLLPVYVPLSWLWLGFSVFVGIIQAYIFTVLTTAYLGMGIGDSH